MLVTNCLVIFILVWIFPFRTKKGEGRGKRSDSKQNHKLRWEWIWTDRLCCMSQPLHAGFYVLQMGKWQKNSSVRYTFGQRARDKFCSQINSRRVHNGLSCYSWEKCCRGTVWMDASVVIIRVCCFRTRMLRKYTYILPALVEYHL